MCPEKADSAKHPRRRRVVGALVEPLEPVGESRGIPDLDDNRSDRARMEFAEEFSIPRTALDREPTTWQGRGDERDRRDRRSGKTGKTGKIGKTEET